MFDIKKFLAGFDITNGEKLGKLIFYAILIIAGLAIYHQLTRPTQNIIAKPGSSVTINNPTKQKNWGIGGNIQSDKTIGVSIMYFF